jgi:hypothetical protein
VANDRVEIFQGFAPVLGSHTVDALELLEFGGPLLAECLETFDAGVHCGVLSRKWCASENTEQLESAVPPEGNHS